MSKVYTNQKTGLTVASGKVKSIGEDKKSFVIGFMEFNRDTKEYEPKDMTVLAPVPVEDVTVGNYVTATGFKRGLGKIEADTINNENAYVEAEGFGVISGKVLFANKNDEIDKATGEPRLTAAGTPRKPHYDITVSVGEGQNRVNHTVKTYNTQDQDNIGRYEKLFANFDREKNPVYVSIVTKVENANSYMRESTDKQGRTWQNQCMSHMGINSLDANFINGKERTAAKAAEAPTQTAPVQEAPQPQAPASNGFNYNLEDLDDMDME